MDKSKLNLNRHKEYLVKRVLGYGTMSDWNQLKADLGLDQIYKIALQVRDLDPKALSFISFLSGIDIKCFRSYNTIQSNKVHWVY